MPPERCPRSRDLRAPSLETRRREPDRVTKGAANLPLVNSRKVTDRGAEVLKREASSTPPTTISTLWLSGPPKTGSPLDMATHLQRTKSCHTSSTAASCSSPQSEPKPAITDHSNCHKCHQPLRRHLHLSRQSTLTTEFEPAARAQDFAYIEAPNTH